MQTGSRCRRCLLLFEMLMVALIGGVYFSTFWPKPSPPVEIETISLADHQAAQRKSADEELRLVELLGKTMSALKAATSKKALPASYTLKGITMIKFSADGSHVLMGMQSRDVMTLDVSSGKLAVYKHLRVEDLMLSKSAAPPLPEKIRPAKPGTITAYHAATKMVAVVEDDRLIISKDE
jgi:hypothetical protein